MNASLIAAALVARDGRYSVRVVLPPTQPKVAEAAEAAEVAGVDVAVERTTDAATVHFVARHQDRRVSTTPVRIQALRRVSPRRVAPASESEAAPPARVAVDPHGQ